MLISAFLGNKFRTRQMSFTEKDVKKTAQLARLSVSDDDCVFYAGQLSQIFELVEQMSKQDTDNIEPMAHPQDIALRLRADEVTEHDHRDSFQSLAPETENGLYLVPRVIT
jgi:aspartyl-tRNA(Asn)/glutamyl-tRNA(Gln) amidotransferase subunit C